MLLVDAMFKLHPIELGLLDYHRNRDSRRSGSVLIIVSADGTLKQQTTIQSLRVKIEDRTSIVV